jgi:hypothetical protein
MKPLTDEFKIVIMVIIEYNFRLPGGTSEGNVEKKIHVRRNAAHIMANCIDKRSSCLRRFSFSVLVNALFTFTFAARTLRIIYTQNNVMFFVHCLHKSITKMYVNAMIIAARKVNGFEKT